MTPEKLVGLFKRAGSRVLRMGDCIRSRLDVKPSDRVPTVWGEHAWHVYLFDDRGQCCGRSAMSSRTPSRPDGRRNAGIS